MTRLTIVFWLFLLTLSAADAGAVTLEPSATANVDEQFGFYDGGNNGRYLTTVSDPATQNIGLVQFSGLASYPTGTQLQGGTATLRLYLDSADLDSGPLTFGIFRNPTAWVGVTTGWNSKPAAEASPAAIFQVTQNVPRFIDIEVGALVQDWLMNPGSNFGFTLQQTSPSSGTLAVFTSSDFTDDVFDQQGFAPELSFEVAAAVPLPAALPLMMVGAGMLGFVGRRRSTD